MAGGTGRRLGLLYRRSFNLDVHMAKRNFFVQKIARYILITDDERLDFEEPVLLLRLIVLLGVALLVVAVLSWGEGWHRTLLKIILRDPRTVMGLLRRPFCRVTLVHVWRV